MDSIYLQFSILNFLLPNLILTLTTAGSDEYFRIYLFLYYDIIASLNSCNLRRFLACEDHILFFDFYLFSDDMTWDELYVLVCFVGQSLQDLFVSFEMFSLLIAESF